MGLNEAQEAELLEAKLTELGPTADRYDILHAINGYSEAAVSIALRRVGGGGGDTSIVQRATVTLTHAQILALADGVQIVAAPAAGKIIVPFNIVIVGDTEAAPYADISPTAQIQAGLADGFSAYALTTTIGENTAGSGVSNLLTGPKTVALLSAATIAPASVTPTTTLGWSFGQDPTVYDGQALMLVIDNGGTPLSGGDPANSLVVTTYYTELDL